MRHAIDADGAPHPMTAALRETRTPSRFASYLALTKPRILPMVVLTGLPVLGMAAGGWPGLGTAVVILLGIAVAAAGANTLNMYVERDRDLLMERTKDRPLPASRISARAALGFGVALSLASTAILWWVGGEVAATLGVASILFYVFVYTVWLKPRSVWNAVIGGAAGAAAPLIADAAVNGSVGAPGLILFSITFFWQPPHVWAIALYRKRDYARAGIPMLPARVGDEATRWWMLACTAGLIPVTLLPGPLGLLGPIYTAAAVALNAWFAWVCVRLVRERDDGAARRVFFVSLAYLGLLHLAMLADLWISPLFRR
jgi:protoheme IX farnesyltransferase